MSPLAQILRQEIDSAGLMPFCRFMDLALYCPGLGYYEGKRSKIGRGGDFYTNPSTGRLFGQLLGFQFAHWLEQISGQPVQLVESGAHEGNLALDILQWLQQNRASILDRMEYWILENSPTRRSWQQETLQSFTDKIRWFDSIESVPQNGIRGVIFSNEFLDALPVHRLGWDASARRWFEWGVAVEQSIFVWQPLPRCSSVLLDELRAADLVCPEELAAVLPDQFTIEICPAAGRWWGQAAKQLQQGFLLTFDYGMTGRDWFSPTRRGGTLRAYRRHQVCSNVLADPGEQDITAHVNFTLLQNRGEETGLETILFQPQERFLTRVLEKAWQAQAEFLLQNSAWKRQFQTLTHPDHLGRAFQILAQKRPGATEAPPRQG
jgi:SAM-dependent MidA family methyltransferase